jgi:nicotinamidase-related amidase/alkylated DNA repair dioxygenase AlkB
MLNLLDLISQNQPHFQTHKALLVIGLQNDFIQPDGKLPADTRTGFLDRIEAVVPKFRQLAANVIWVQTLYDADRVVNDPTSEGDTVLVEPLEGLESSDDDDEDLPRDSIQPTTPSKSSRRRALELLKRVSARKKTIPRTASPSPAEEEELFLSKASKKGPSCVPGTPGAEFADKISSKIDLADTIVRTSHYSAFLGTQLLLILRAKLVTELYICGCITNVSVFATVVDAARHGIKIYIVEDCLGYRKRNRHDDAVKKMVDYIEANLITSTEILNRSSTPETPPQPRSRNGSYDTQQLEDMVGKLLIKDEASSIRTKSKAPSVSINGRPRTLSDASIAESRATTDTKLSDEQFMEKLSRGARLSTDSSYTTSEKPNLVKSKIRMRSRKKVDSIKPKAESSQKPEATKKNEPSKKAEVPKKEESSKKVEPTKKDDPSVNPKTKAEQPTEAPAESPKTATPAVETVPRHATVTKAESSDKLRESQVKREHSLKYSASQPVLSAASIDQKDKSSKARTPLGRPSKPESAKTTKPLKPPLENPKKSSTTPTKPPMPKKLQSLATFPVLKPGDRIAEGDSRIIYDFFSPDYRHPTDPSKPLKELIFYQLYNEVRWQKMFHVQGEVPRLVCCQGEFGADGSMPVYRHPSDQALPLLHFSPKVLVIRKQAEKLVGHPLNHVLIQLYRSGQDYISEHSDKTLDIVRGSSIVNVSFGAQRTMRLRTKKSAAAKTEEQPSDESGSRHTQRVAMPHNSMFVLGQKSNMKWLHGIQPDKRMSSERSPDEKAYSGMRISLTFRNIGTFLDHEGSTIWGQGATAKDQRDGNDVINDDEEETESMVRAFSKENHDTDFDWDEHYGEGFDVLHFRTPPEDMPILFASNNEVENRMVKAFLADTKLKHVVCEVPTNDKAYEIDRQVCIRDNDINHTEVSIAVPILIYLDRYYPMDRDERGRSCNAESYDIFITVSGMLKYWVNRAVPTYYNDFCNVVAALEERCAHSIGPFISGRRFSIGDCATWPAVDELVTNWDEWSQERFPHLTEYYLMVWKKKKSIRELRKELPAIRKKAVERSEESSED